MLTTIEVVIDRDGRVRPLEPPYLTLLPIRPAAARRPLPPGGQRPTPWPCCIPAFGPTPCQRPERGAAPDRGAP
jgi:hypothetical protein